MESITQNEKVLYVGIDVHKDTYALCCFDFQRNELSDEMIVKGTTKAVISYLEAIKQKHREELLFVCGYEAGPQGTDFAGDCSKQALDALSWHRQQWQIRRGKDE